MARVDTTTIEGINAASGFDTASDTGVATAISYGISEALLGAYPELQAVYTLFKQNKTAAALEALYKTNYYKNLSPAVKTRSKLKLEQPGVYADSFEKYKLQAKKRLVQTGIKIDDATLNTLAQTAYDQGLDDNQFDMLIKTSGKILGYGGTTLGTVSDLQSYSRAFGVDNMFNKAFWDSQSAELAIGNTTTEDIEAQIRETAASAYPSYAESIRKGVSVDDLQRGDGPVGLLSVRSKRRTDAERCRNRGVSCAVGTNHAAALPRDHADHEWRLQIQRYLRRHAPPPACAVLADAGIPTCHRVPCRLSFGRKRSP
jgi:hypothetical protein